jgi:diadenosine tetraphosphate (Ap4A) HIT family hydrolase
MEKYKHTTDNGECIFCEIAKGNMKPLGEGLIYEDNKYMAWLSPFPNTEGFSVVIIKEHFGSDLLSLEDSVLQDFILVAKKVSKMLLNHFPDVGRVGLIMEGTGMNHAHIKLFPMHGTEYLKSGEWKQFPHKHMEYYDKYEGYICSNDGPKADFDKLKELAYKIKGE